MVRFADSLLVMMSPSSKIQKHKYCVRYVQMKRFVEKAIEIYGFSFDPPRGVYAQ